MLEDCLMHSLRTRTFMMAATAALARVLAVPLLMQLPRPADAAGQERTAAQASKTSDEQAIRKAGAAHVEAMNKGDLNAVMAFWAPDADYIDESGKPTKGK